MCTRVPIFAAAAAAAVLAGCGPAVTPAVTSAADSRLAVEIVADEAEAVLHILDIRAAGGTPVEADWSRLFQTEGYRRLQQRERSLQRSFEDSTFRAFALSDTLAERARDLRLTLEGWLDVDPHLPAARAFAYLPQHTIVRARIYPVIKPLSNSFVFETRTDPAIFLYLDPALSREKFDNILAHELHHIGHASSCMGVPADTTIAPGVQAALDWMGAFGEGRAMLAAAGAADVHPHAVSAADERTVWERDIANVHTDMKRMEDFFFDLMDERLTEEEAVPRGFMFIATDSVPQGAFYTIGWLMAATIERELGRDRLVASTCDPRMFIGDYQRAATRRNRGSGESLPLWSARLLARIGASAD